MSDLHRKGRVTIPTDVDVVPETLALLERWGADAIRDCDGTGYDPEGQRLGKSQPGRGAAVLFDDGFPHRQRRRAVYSAAQGREFRASGGQ